MFQACHLEDAAERLPFHFSPGIPAPRVSLTVDPGFPVSFVFFLGLLSRFGGGMSSTFFLRGRMEDELPCISRAFVLCFCRMGCPGECPCSELFPPVSVGTGSFSCFCCCFRISKPFCWSFVGPLFLLAALRVSSLPQRLEGSRGTFLV